MGKTKLGLTDMHHFQTKEKEEIQSFKQYIQCMYIWENYRINKLGVNCNVIWPWKIIKILHTYLIIVQQTNISIFKSIAYIFAQIQCN